MMGSGDGGRRAVEVAGGDAIPREDGNGTASAVVFVHVPKAAGSTVIYALKRLYGRDKVWVRPGLGWPMSVPEEAPADVPVIAGHMSVGVHSVVGRPVVYLSVVREPLARLVSAYRHIRRRPRSPLHESVRDMSLEEFLVGHPISPEFDNGQIRRLVADGEAIPLGACTTGHLDDVLARVDSGELLLGATEQVEASLVHFADALGWGSPYFWSQNVGPSRALDLPEAVVAAVCERQWADFRLHAAVADSLATRDPEFDERVQRFILTNRYGYRPFAMPLMAVRKVKVEMNRLRRRAFGG